MEKRRILFIGDGVTPTGFSTVMHGIIGNLPTRLFEIHHLAVNYTGDPHDYNWKIYPAMPGGNPRADYLGYDRLRNLFSQMEFDGIFILNDVWVVNNYLKIIRESFPKIPPIVVYFPVDSKFLDEEWFQNFDIVTRIGVYTKFGFDQVNAVYDKGNISIVPHGVNTETFKKISNTRQEVKKVLFPSSGEFQESFIVLSASRNQPRKRIDIALESFALFAEDKPENVKFYFHGGLRDAGFDVMRIAKRLNLEKRIILTNLNKGLQTIPTTHLNYIYNACDVGINTSTGEGWSLTNMEHAVTGAPQVLPDHSVMREVFEDCSLLVPVNQELVNIDNSTVGSLVHPRDVAESLNRLYYDKELYESLSSNGLKKFTDAKYSWDYIAKELWLPIFREVYDI